MPMRVQTHVRMHEQMHVHEVCISGYEATREMRETRGELARETYAGAFPFPSLHGIQAREVHRAGKGVRKRVWKRVSKAAVRLAGNGRARERAAPGSGRPRGGGGSFPGPVWGVRVERGAIGRNTAGGPSPWRS
ncbi:hypothetical protein SGFS_068430 [Streptomyces graminofaciens]|uniref:Uncharacterized protein n=1 Tax=Streptomyces graminofaciens TaxID=68212 RepID=A0ABM7FER5_9ACTN|nr:hypothetical protein SGFS_068430 [Streptomyces graminofaciens]